MKTLELSEMEILLGGGDVLTDADSCNRLADGITGAAVVIGFSSWWTGVGAGLSLIASLVSVVADAYCDSL